MKKTFLIFLLSILMFSCSIEPKPIEYGLDNCSYCKMTIVDEQHAAQIVTQKGRAYNFDAIECMIDYRREYLEQPVALYLVTTFGEPGKLTNAVKAEFLVSPELPSPMGGNLTAFQSHEKAAEAKSKYPGRVLDWEELFVNYQSKNMDSLK